ncbi:hypothetical protein F511_16833 [Dorcoceras hygrometricum]|uniref:Dystroglycan-like n=1 Tax=Dorcoceras hygrometricum TaxID=472368 RepID=A0A2Z7AVX0_9LAMI|nr:hypothetical protein F511_16833 [Dorcoceras hygrometricum]
MAASFYNNSVHVDFESALAMGEPGMVSMFQALIPSGLQGFLGCPAVVYEDALVEFFANGTVRDGLVVSTVNGVAVEISEKLFAETFDLPVDGLADIFEMPKDKIFDARSIVSLTGEPVTLSGLKSQMKMHYRLLCDIMAKSISVKAGSFNAITVEKFSLLTAVVCDVKMNWGRILFGFLKKMVTPGTKQAKGFAIQISILLESVPNLELGASSEFPSSKIHTDKTIHRYIAIIDKSGAQDPADAPKIKKAPMTKAASKKRPADPSPLDVPVVKRKRTSKKKSTLKLVAVAQEAIPIQIVPAESAVEPMVEDQQTATEDAADQPAAEEETPADRSADEILNVEQRVDESAVEVSGVDVVDPETVIQQVLNQLACSTEERDVAKGDRVETWFDQALAEEFATPGGVSPTEKANDEIPWFVRPFLSADHDNERLFETGSDSAAAMDFEKSVVEFYKGPVGGKTQYAYQQRSCNHHSLLVIPSEEEEVETVFLLITLLATRAWLQPELQERWLFTVGGGRFVNQVGRSKSDEAAACTGGDGGEVLEEKGSAVSSTLGSRTPQNPPQVLNTLSSVSMRESRIQYLCDPQWFRDTASRGPTTIVAPESQFRICPSDHDSIGYPRMSASGESSTTMHRLLHASGPHPIPPPNDSKTNQYNQDLGLIHSTNGNHLESPNEDSSIDHQVTIYLHAQNITMFPTNETWYFPSQILVSSSVGLILILTAQSTRN